MIPLGGPAAAELQILMALARGEREIQEGKGPSLDAVLREADKLLQNR